MSDPGVIRLAAVLALTVLIVPAALQAGVEGSPHDLISQGYVTAGSGNPRGSCQFCHLPSGGKDEPIPDWLPPSVRYFARPGLDCYSCHDGTTIVSPEVDANLTAYHRDSHPLELGALEPAAFREGDRLPEILQKRLECGTCHNPHDNSVRPFLRMNFFELCSVCHRGFGNEGDGIQNPMSNHPVHETILGEANPAIPIDPSPEFLVPFPQDYPVNGGRDKPGVHWLLGGHLQGGEEGTMECVTCHAAHGSEGSPPRPGLLVLEPSRTIADLFCEGCHRGVRGDGLESAAFPNPGGTVTARTYHPCDDDEGNGPGRLLKTRDPAGWPLGQGSPPVILCTTCHTAHGGLPGSPILRSPSTARTFCEECHSSEEMPFHHPSGPGSNPDRICLALPEEYGIGESVRGEIYCSSCHTAHNAGLGKKEEYHVPSLKDPWNEDDLCLSCHSGDNVSCDPGKDGTASHFTGDPTLSDTYQDPAPPLREEVWPETNLASRYGGDSAIKVLCLSCHSFRGAPSSGLKGPLEHYLLARGGDDVEWADDPGVYLCTGCHGEDPATMGEGHTHPLLEADVNALEKEPSPPATHTPTGSLNCDSCHLSHGAPPAGGYYILEEVISANEDPGAIHPQVNYTSLCQLCHSSDKY